MKKIIKVIFVCATFLYSQIVYSQVFDPTIASNLQIKIDSLRNVYSIQGVSTSVYYPNGGLWQGVSGYSTGGTHITPDMKFGIASNTKLFTAVSLLKLDEENILSIEDELNVWLPPMDFVNPNIKVKQLLNHSSGVFDFVQVIGIADSISIDRNRVFTPLEVISWIDSPLFTAGTNTSYSSTNTLVAGLVFESAAGESIESYIRTNFLLPHSLNNTFFPIDEAVMGIIAHPWDEGIDINNFSRTSINSIAWAAGAIYSTSSDMNTWYQKLFNSQIINSNSISKMITIEGIYGLGIIEYNIDGRLVYGHTGNTQGYSSITIYDTETESVISVLINESDAPVEIISEVLLLALVNEFAVLNTSNPVDNYGIKIYPNPTENIITVNIPSNINFEYIKLIDLKGASIISSTSKTISIKHLANGIYFLKVNTDKNEVNFKVIKK